MLRRFKRFLTRVFDPLVGALVAVAFWILRRVGLDRSSDALGALARRIGPWLPEHKIGQRQLRAAYPDKDAAWIETTLSGAWENLGRVIGEFVHLDRMWDYDHDTPNTGRIVTDDAQKLLDMRDDGKPALIFTAHLANWELPALAAARHGLASAVLYRMPNSPSVARRIVAIREHLMGRLIRSRREAGVELAGALERGEHLGMLVDQFWARGVDVTFFGRTCKANPTLARLARHYDCPVYGVRVIRLPGRRLRLASTGPVDLPRDAEGLIDIKAATQTINTIVEVWIREHPEQWLWFHRKWR